MSAFNNVYEHGNYWFPSSFSKILRTVVDGNQDVFKYGLQRGSGSEYEDPTFLGFTLEVDEDRSPIFGELMEFLNRYRNSLPEMAARIPVAKRLQRELRRFFSSQESVVDPNDADLYIKSHYINSISGLSKLNNPFIKYGEDKLQINLQDDIALSGTYFANLHKHLAYSYATGRVMIPENLLKFVLRIKVSEIRNFTSVPSILRLQQPQSYSKSELAEAARVLDALRVNTTCLVYTLWDCHISAMQTAPFEDEIELAGMDAGTRPNATSKLYIFYKSVSRYMRPSLLVDAIPLDDLQPGLGLSPQSDQATGGAGQAGASTTMVQGDGQSPYQSPNIADGFRFNTPGGFGGEGAQRSSWLGQEVPDDGAYDMGPQPLGAGSPMNPPTPADTPRYGGYVDSSGLAEYERQRQELRKFMPTQKGPEPDSDTGPFADGYEPQALFDKVKANVLRNIERTKNDFVDRVKAQEAAARREMMNSIIGKVQKVLGIKKIIPSNVYYPEVGLDAILQQVKSDIGFGVFGALGNGESIIP